MKATKSNTSADEQKSRARAQASYLSKPTASSSSATTPMASGRKHGFSLGRFSLRRLLNPSSFNSTFTRTMTSGNKQRSSQFRDSHSENGSTGDTFKSVSNAKPSSFCPTYSSIDFESNSISSARSDMTHGEATSSGYRSHSHAAQAGPGVHLGSLCECPLCLLELPLECFPALASCTHRACYDCLQQYLKIEISESRVNISCPECTEPIHPNDIRMILNDDTFMGKYETFMLRRVLVAEPDARWCPAPDCCYVVIAAGCAGCPKLQCNRPGCDTFFCYHCKQEWHPNQTCDAARAQRNLRGSPNSSADLEAATQRDDIKPCPCCKVLIIKMDDGSCNHMTCSVCGTEFCWLCMKEISDLHYLSPSGCTFWGKKPWSRKKKIMWQLGMLVGAPVGIALIAGIAVPAIIIGIPVWVGRKLHARFVRQSMSRPKRNLLVASGVLTSVFVSPILAAVAVGIGVPILLAYVYGVVPISLCRSGGCGVTTSGSGVRIEMDEEENEIGLSSNTAPDGLSVDTALSHKGVNPSIGEVSFGMSTSLSMGSGSHLDGHLDRTGGDRESVSNVALAGSIASGNASLGPPHKLEVQADVSSNKRFSFSSHSETASATVSLSERSANMSLMDDASTKALAGSIAGCREVCVVTPGPGSAPSAVTPVEVHVDACALQCVAIGSSCCCDDSLSGKSVRLNMMSNQPNATKVRKSEFLNHAICYIEESANSEEVAPVGGPAQSPDVSSRCISFQSALGTKTKFESRSLEQLANYCEVCNKIHRPCCPNYNYINGRQTNQSTPGSDKSRVQKGDDQPHKSVMKSSSMKSSRREGHRKGSIKSTHSDTSNATSSSQKHMELKRVRSSEYGQRTVPLNSDLVPKSTPTSPLESSSFPFTCIPSKGDRAYYPPKSSRVVVTFPQK